MMGTVSVGGGISEPGMVEAGCRNDTENHPGGCAVEVSTEMSRLYRCIRYLLPKSAGTRV